MDTIFDFHEIGKLKMDTILFESFYPILFTCTNNENKLFLCVCCTHNKEIQIWLLRMITPLTVIDLLENRITIRDAFLSSKDDKYTIIEQNKNKILKINDMEYWDVDNSKYLPTIGEYMDADDDEFIEEINHFKNINFEKNQMFYTNGGMYVPSISKNNKYEISADVNNKLTFIA